MSESAPIPHNAAVRTTTRQSTVTRVLPHGRAAAHDDVTGSTAVTLIIVSSASFRIRPLTWTARPGCSVERNAATLTSRNVCEPRAASLATPPDGPSRAATGSVAFVNIHELIRTFRQASDHGHQREVSDRARSGGSFLRDELEQLERWACAQRHGAGGVAVETQDVGDHGQRRVVVQHPGRAPGMVSRMVWNSRSTVFVSHRAMNLSPPSGGAYEAPT